MEIFETVQGKLVIWLILVSSISLHEWGHAFSADKRGDPLPRHQGRVTLNPLAHIDPIGTVLIPLMMLLLSPGFGVIGWGKPVQISLPNPKTRMKDDLIITACGPLMNLIIATVCAILGGIALRMGVDSLFQVAYMAVLLNAMLIVFNCIPIPPLDGSHFLRYAINMSEELYMQLSRWGFIILLVLINVPLTRDLISSAIAIGTMPFLWLMGVIGG